MFDFFHSELENTQFFVTTYFKYFYVLFVGFLKLKDVSNEVEWYKVLLKVHNFRDYKYDSPKWDHANKKYIIVDTSTEELRNNFILAKKEIKKK